ncbi:KCS17 [Scenedesmus sp. PABB004]|nr:KCS17 [Scenedesmus sp. PABB004]
MEFSLWEYLCGGGGGQALPWPALALAAAVALALAALAFAAGRRQAPVYLLDFVAARPDDSWSHSRAQIEAAGEASKFFSQETFDFQRKVLYASGLGNETYSPDWLHSFPQDTSIAKGRLEFSMLALTATRELFERTGVSPADVGVVVVNSSVFCPTPSLAAMVMNHFKMAPDTIHFNLGGMGCAASPIAIDCARQALAVKRNTYALVLSTEVITQGVYTGTQRSMLVPNVLFRSGGAAMLLTNKPSEARRSKYVLRHLVRTAVMADDAAYGAAVEMEDDAGIKGIKLSRELPRIAASALQLNLAQLGPKVLPWSEKLRFAANWSARRLLRRADLKPYRPDLQKAAAHICIHTGGKAVIDGIKGELSLSDATCEPSRAALYRYGNTSSSSLWYVLSYIESFRGSAAATACCSWRSARASSRGAAPAPAPAADKAMGRVPSLADIARREKDQA